MKKIFTFILIGILLSTSFSVISAQEDNESVDEISDCSKIENRVQDRIDYYSINTDIIIGKLNRTALNLERSETIFSLMGFETEDYSRAILRLERDIKNIEDSKKELVSDFEKAKTSSCTNERSFNSYIRSAALSLEDLKSQIKDTKEYINNNIEREIIEFRF